MWRPSQKTVCDTQKGQKLLPKGCFLPDRFGHKFVATHPHLPKTRTLTMFDQDPFEHQEPENSLSKQTRRLQFDRRSPVSVSANTPELDFETETYKLVVRPQSPRARKSRGTIGRRSSISATTVDRPTHRINAEVTKSQRSSHRRVSLHLFHSANNGSSSQEGSLRGHRYSTGARRTSGAIYSGKPSSSVSEHIAQNPSRTLGGSSHPPRTGFTDDFDPFDDVDELDRDNIYEQEFPKLFTQRSSHCRRASLGDLLKETTTAHRCPKTRSSNPASLRYMIEKDASNTSKSKMDQPTHASGFSSTGWTISSGEAKTISSSEPSVFSSTGWSVSGDSTDSSLSGKKPRRGRRPSLST